MKLYKNLQTALKEREQVTAIKLSLREAHFPTEIFNLVNLEEAFFEGNVNTFPMKIEGWSKLKAISLKWPNFKGNLSSLFSLSCLENLKIIETPLKTFLLPLGLVVAPLKSVTIKDCALEKLPEEFSMLSKLSELNLSGNNLHELPFSFRELKQLKRLNLDQNEFKKLPNFIKAMPNLSHLSIDGNLFSEDEKARIQREFHIWPN